MRKLCIALVSLTAIAADAQWSTNWPAWSFPREQNDQLRQCYSAVVERCTVAGVAAPSAPAWYRLNRTTVVNLKSKSKELLPYFVRSDLTTEGDFVEYYWNLPAPAYNDDVPCFTVTGLLSTCKLPTNYFDYTPYRGLSGNTNSGETNATTAQGGTTYPEGRTCWYTSDYGIDQMTSVVSRLFWTRKDAACSVYEYRHGDPGGSVFATVLALAKTYWSDSPFTTSDGGWAQILSYGIRVLNHSYNADYDIAKSTHSYRWTVSSIPTNYAHEVQMYQWAQPSVYAGCTNIVFNDWGLGFSDQCLTLRTNWLGSASAYTNEITTNVVINVDPVDPGDVPDVETFSSVGMNVGYNAKCLINWAVTNGFRYK